MFSRLMTLVLLSMITMAQDRVSRDPNNRIRIQPTSRALDCPDEKNQRPSPDTLQPTDFVELERTSCFGACPAYTVRIGADGQVSWTGKRGVVSTSSITATVSPADARALIDRLAANGFWNLCGRYEFPATDGATTNTTLHIGQYEKRVSNYLNGGPSVLQQFEFAIDALSDTHRWIHGDPRTELIQHVRLDGEAVKPGLTPLMRASLVADGAEIQRLLDAKAEVNAQDSSGWTALVYAAQGEKKGRVDAATYSSGVDSIKTLLNAGANPNGRSFMGQTPLMAAVTAFYSPVEKARLLIAAGADVNAQDQNGRTALMHIINGSLGQDIAGKYEEQVQLCLMLLSAGAFTDPRDSNGHNVLDLLDEELRRWSTPNHPAAFVQSARMQYEALLRALRR